jgi:ribosome-binding protein aMBF1 (putative translation factor)
LSIRCGTRIARNGNRGQESADYEVGSIDCDGHRRVALVSDRVSSPVELYPSTSHDSGMAKPSPSHAGDPSLVALGEAIRQRRLKLGLSQEGLALEVGLDRSYLGGVERGEHNVAIMNIVKIANSLKLSVAKLLDSAGL